MPGIDSTLRIHVPVPNRKDSWHDATEFCRRERDSQDGFGRHRPRRCYYLCGAAMSRPAIKCGGRRPTEPLVWLVLVGDDAIIERYVQSCTSDEDIIRRKLDLAPDVPILVGRPPRST